MRAINAAYAVLSDPARRAAYDARRYLARVHVATASAANRTTNAVRPRQVVARPPTTLQRRVDRLVGIIGVLLLLAIGFYVVNIIPLAEQEFQAARRGVIPLRGPLSTSLEHAVGTVPQRVRTDDGLRTFPNTVLVAPADLRPFADLPVVRVDANSRGLARYAVYYGDWSAGGITITGLIGRSAFDSAEPQIAGCAPGAGYCVGPAPGQTSGPPGQELFRADDLVEDYPAFAAHRVCCNGVFWSLSWYEQRANMSYTIDLSRTQAAAFGNGIGAENATAAHELGALARQLVRLP
jgi:hypothetical protein